MNGDGQMPEGGERRQVRQSLLRQVAAPEFQPLEQQHPFEVSESFARDRVAGQVKVLQPGQVSEVDQALVSDAAAAEPERLEILRSKCGERLQPALIYFSLDVQVQPVAGGNVHLAARPTQFLHLREASTNSRVRLCEEFSEYPVLWKSDGACPGHACGVDNPCYAICGRVAVAVRPTQERRVHEVRLVAWTFAQGSSSG